MSEPPWRTEVGIVCSYDAGTCAESESWLTRHAETLRKRFSPKAMGEEVILKIPLEM